MKPTWKVIAGHEKFMISSQGKVKSRGYKIKYDDGEEVVVKSKEIEQKEDNSYLYVRLNGSTCFVHRLVAQHFLPNPHNYRFVEHADGDRSNNDVSNLKWSENNPAVMRMKEQFAVEGYKNGKAVMCVESNQSFRSIKEAAEAFGLKYSVVRNAIGTGRKVNGLTFI